MIVMESAIHSRLDEALVAVFINKTNAVSPERDVVFTFTRGFSRDLTAGTSNILAARINGVYSFIPVRRFASTLSSLRIRNLRVESVARAE